MSTPTRYASMMILVTGATGLVGSALLRRLSIADFEVRCLVRDPLRLGPERVRVQIALGDLGDPRSFRNAMRNVDTVIHLAATIRDQPQGTIEELNAVATWRLVQAAKRAGVKRFIYFSALGASLESPARFFRSKALAQQVVGESGIPATVLAPSIVYAPGDPWITLLSKLALLPVMPVAGSGQACYQPVWAEDVAELVMRLLEQAHERAPAKIELVGPDVLSYEEIVRVVLQSLNKRRRLVHLRWPALRRTLEALELVFGSKVFATWEEAQLMAISMVTQQGTADMERLGVNPKSMRTVLGVD